MRFINIGSSLISVAFCRIRMFRVYYVFILDEAISTIIIIYFDWFGLVCFLCLMAYQPLVFVRKWT